MNPNFEIKYLALTWYNQDTVTKVTESLNALPLEYDGKHKIFKAETTIYPMVAGIDKGHIGIRVFSKEVNPPYIKMANGKIKYLSPVKDSDTGFVWWVFKDTWDREQKQWLGVAPNIVGTIRLFIEGTLCEIDINGSYFTREELGQYLSAFKNDLWELILDESSAVQADAKNSQDVVANYEIIDCINNLVFHAHKILETPKVELHEIQALKPRKSVKPIKRTFLELATKTNQRFLSSRATEPSYNVAENRYILFVLERCYRIIKQIVILSKNKSNRYLSKANALKEQYDSFTDTIQVDRDLFVRDLELILEHSKLEYWQALIDSKLKNSDIELQEHPCADNFYINLEGFTKVQGGERKNGFFVRVSNGHEWVKPAGKSGILNLSDRFSELLNILGPGMVLRLNCDYNWRKTENSVQFYLERLYAIEIIDFSGVKNARESFRKEREIGKQLAANGWIKNLSPQEIHEQEEEKISLLNRVDFYTESQKKSSYVYERTEPKLRAIKKIIQRLKSLKITPSSHFPNSMTFVQNPHYQGVHNNYKILRDITSLNDDELLLSLEKIDAMGLVNMPLLYERWVLIQIMLTLKEAFRFVPQGDWKYRLIDAIQTNQTDIEVTLSNEKAKRYISLWYEKTLSNGKRPDFVLDLTWFPEFEPESDELRPSPLGGDCLDKISKFNRFVLDAKFYDRRTFDRAGGMMAKINELYIDKNYSEDGGNPVFLIHPCANLIDKRVTAQEWGRYSFLGELNFWGDNEIPPFHEKGAVFLSPINRARHNDELQRMLGLFIQYKLESSDTEGQSDDRTQAVPICIRCGSNDIIKIEKEQYYINRVGERVKRTESSVWMQCAECKQIQIYNHCRKYKTRLVKNGFYWSYHSARTLEPFNMKCPECGEWGAW